MEEKYETQEKEEKKEIGEDDELPDSFCPINPQGCDDEECLYLHDRLVDGYLFTEGEQRESAIMRRDWKISGKKAMKGAEILREERKSQLENGISCDTCGRTVSQRISYGKRTYCDMDFNMDWPDSITSSKFPSSEYVYAEREKY